MGENGSPEPVFEFDEEYSYFMVRLPVHEEILKKYQENSSEIFPSNGTKLALSRHQVDILYKCQKASALVDLLAITGRSDRTKFRDQVLRPLLDHDFIEMTHPDKPRSSKQKYRLAEKGRHMLAEIKGVEGDDTI